MSEYQYIAFRAIDGPVSDANLAYMQRQSSRAEITPWSFDNEYHWGDFRGNALEMLRRGYDLHLHYANFGIRKLLIRLPRGLPDPTAAKAYLVKDALELVRDKGGAGTTLRIEPFHEPGDLEELWEFDDLIDELLPLRAELLNGDLRPLYLAHLAVSCDGNHDPDSTIEAPVPAGLDHLTDAQLALAECYGLSDALIAAAAREGPALPAKDDRDDQALLWLSRQPQSAKDRWLADWIADPHSTARREILSAYRNETATPAWPCARPDRTIAELHAIADDVQRNADAREAAKAAKERSKRLAAMARNPNTTIREIDKLIDQRSTRAYHQIANTLVDLREALAGGSQAGLAEQHAQKLRKQHSTLKKLISELRRAGLLPK